MDFFHKTNPIKQNWFDGYFFSQLFFTFFGKWKCIEFKKKQSQTEQQKKKTRPE